MISCVYCGGEHATPADVKACWSRSQSSTPAATPSTRSPSRPTGPTGSALSAPPSPRDEPARPNRPAAGRPGPGDEPVLSRQRATTPIRRRGPHQLGRHALVGPGDGAPAGWEDCERVRIGPEQLADAAATVTRLRALHHSGTSAILELDGALDGRFVAQFPPESVERRPVHQLDPGFTFWLDELHHLVFVNSFDGRDGTTPDTGDDGRGDGEGAWVDHGPIRYLPPVDGVPIVHSVAWRGADTPPPLGNASTADLAADQLAAVTHGGASARIIAPAGSGKTRVLTERARHLLQQWRLPPEAVCLVAFNKRAQEEMRERTADLSNLQVRTLNSIALAIINGRAPYAPVDRRRTTIDEPEVRRILGQLVKTPRRLNVDPLATWVDALSSVRLGLRAPHDVEQDYAGDVAGLGDVYEQFVGILERQGAVDFDHQIIGAIELLLTDPAARRTARAACRVLLVDEFQDLTPAHLLLVRLLAGPAGAVFGVGDDDQTIYGYNGADPAWLIDFSKWFPGAGDHPLEVNYRCPSGIVAAADNLLRHNFRRVDKTIRATDTAPANGWIALSSADPVDATVTAVEAALETGSQAGDIAVLTRVNTTIAPVQVALNILGVPISGGVGTDYAERTAVRAAFAWLRIAESDQLDAADIGEALRRPSRKLHPRVRDWVAEQRNTDGIRKLAGRLNNDKDSRNVEEFADDVELLQGMFRRNVPTSDILQYLVEDIGLGVAVSTLDGGRRGTNRSAQGDDLQAFRQIAKLYDQHGDGPFEPWLKHHLAARRSDAGVVLSTVHRVKGQEWPHVVVHLADNDQYPHRLAEDDEEERRLFHVALTRASSHATIISGPRPSRFVAELTGEPPATPPEPAPAPRRGTTTGERKAPAHPLADRTQVFAAVGTTLLDQGQEWEIVDIEVDGAVARRGETTRRFRLGSKVETVGRQRGQLAPRPGSVGEASVVAFDQLRIFREGARDGKPAYVVFDDKTLAFIADELPADLSELSAVSGVGPAKLEQYGDDVVAIIADVRDRFGITDDPDDVGGPNES